MIYPQHTFRQMPSHQLDFVSDADLYEAQQMIELWRAVLREFVKDLESTNNAERDYAMSFFEEKENEHRASICFLAALDEDWVRTHYRSGALQKWVQITNTHVNGKTKPRVKPILTHKAA